MKKCPKCGYARPADDPTSECPRCGIVYAKFKAPVVLPAPAPEKQIKRSSLNERERDTFKAIGTGAIVTAATVLFLLPDLARWTKWYWIESWWAISLLFIIAVGMCSEMYAKMRAIDKVAYGNVDKTGAENKDTP